MITARRESEALTIDVPRGATAIFDSEWLPAGDGPVGGMLVRRDGEMIWCDFDGTLRQMSSVPDQPRDEIARRLLQGMADEALRVAGGAMIDVIGDGALATSLRKAAGVSDAPGAAVVVDTTGSAAAVAAALDRLPQLGTLVLAGPAAREDPDLDVYANLHLRGLRITAIAPSLGQSSHTLSPTHVRAGEPLPAATWYCVSDV